MVDYKLKAKTIRFDTRTPKPPEPNYWWEYALIGLGITGLGAALGYLMPPLAAAMFQLFGW